jgi:hypothetical protein
MQVAELPGKCRFLYINMKTFYEGLIAFSPCQEKKSTDIKNENCGRKIKENVIIKQHEQKRLENGRLGD